MPGFSKPNAGLQASLGPSFARMMSQSLQWKCCCLGPQPSGPIHFSIHYPWQGHHLQGCGRDRQGSGRRRGLKAATSSLFPVHLPSPEFLRTYYVPGTGTILGASTYISFNFHISPLWGVPLDLQMEKLTLGEGKSLGSSGMST